MTRRELFKAAIGAALSPVLAKLPLPDLAKPVVSAASPFRSNLWSSAALSSSTLAECIRKMYEPGAREVCVVPPELYDTAASLFSAEGTVKK